VCGDFDATAVQCEGENNHVHLLIDHPPTVRARKLVNSLTGVSSWRLRQRFVIGAYRERLWSLLYVAIIGL